MSERGQLGRYPVMVQSVGPVQVTSWQREFKLRHRDEPGEYSCLVMWDGESIGAYWWTPDGDPCSAPEWAKGVEMELVDYDKDS